MPASATPLLQVRDLVQEFVARDYGGVKGGVVHGRKRKRVLKEAAGFTGGPGTIYRVALEFEAMPMAA